MVVLSDHLGRLAGADGPPGGLRLRRPGDPVARGTRSEIGASESAGPGVAASSGDVLRVTLPIPGPAGADRLAMVMGAVIGAGLGRALAGLLGVERVVVTAVLMLGAAVVMAVVMQRARRRSVERARFEQWCAAAVLEARAAWEEQVLQAMLGAEAERLAAREAYRRDCQFRADLMVQRIDAHLVRARARVEALEQDIVVLAGASQARNR